MKFLSSPLAKTVLTIVAVVLVWNILSPYLVKIPVIGPYLEFSKA